MTTLTKSLLVWSPRILCIAFSLFISIFALDVFEHAQGFWRTTLALLIHLIPTALLLAILALSWRWEWTGGVLFTALGAWYIWSAWGRFSLATYLLISGPLFIVGALFLMNWFLRAQLHSRQA